MPFDPDQYLQEKTAAGGGLSEPEELEMLQLKKRKYLTHGGADTGSAGLGGGPAGFDPDAYLSQKVGPHNFDAPGSAADKASASVEPGVEAPHLDAPAQPESWGHYAGRKALGILPTAGLVAGTIAGAPEGGVGAIPAGAAGYTAGKYLENAGRRHLLGDELPQDPGGPLGELVGTTGEGIDQATQGAAIGKMLSPVGQYIANRLKGTGISAARLHLRPTAGTANALGEEGVDAAAEEALRAGAIQPFSKAKTTAKNLDNLLDEVGAVKGDIIKNSAATVNPVDVAETATSTIVNPLAANSETEGTAAAMSRKVGGFLRKYAPEAEQGGEIEPQMGVGQLDAVKQAAQSKNNYLATSPQAVARQQAQRDWAGILKNAVEKAEPEVMPANQAYHNLANASEMADRTSALADGGGGLPGHITDVGAVGTGVSAALSGHPAALAIPVVRALTKGRVASTLAAGSYGAGDALQNALPTYANPVANAIAARLAGTYQPQSQAPRDKDPRSAMNGIKSRQTLRQDFTEQQIDHDAQEELKRSQE